MEYSHKSVLLAEVTQQLRCSNGQTIVDCTLGGAGHSEKILDLIIPDGFLLGIDQDIAAIDAATVRVARFSQHFAFIRGSFADLDNILEDAGVDEVDGFILESFSVSFSATFSTGSGISASSTLCLNSLISDIGPSPFLKIRIHHSRSGFL